MYEYQGPANVTVLYSTLVLGSKMFFLNLHVNLCLLEAFLVQEVKKNKKINRRSTLTYGLTVFALSSVSVWLQG